MTGSVRGLQGLGTSRAVGLLLEGKTHARGSVLMPQMSFLAVKRECTHLNRSNFVRNVDFWVGSL